MWNLRSLCFRTDLFIAAFDGAVEDQGDCFVLRTPSNPDFWWGNFVLHRNAPDDRSFADGEGSWIEHFARTFPAAKVELVAWDCPDGARGMIEPALAKGFAVDEGVVLSATEVVRPPRHNDAVVVEALRSESDRDWMEAGDALARAFAPRRSGSLSALHSFVERQLVRYRAMQRQGLGQWFAARLDGRVAGALGMVRVGEVGRFQLVGTDPAFARQGVCSTMVHHVARWGLEDAKLGTLVMAADETYHAARIYQSVGFKRTESLCALIRKPPAS